MTIKVVLPELVFEHAGNALVDAVQKTAQPSLVLLSGGSAIQSYRPFVDALLKEQIKPYGVGLIDERYGKVGHVHSNAAAIEKQFELQKLCEDRGVQFCPILRNKPIEQEVSHYNDWVKKMFAICPIRISVFGLGVDGHTAGILPMQSDRFDEVFETGSKVIGYESEDMYRVRITLSPTAIRALSKVIVIAAGESKRTVLRRLISGDGDPYCFVMFQK
jgi:6-phosphogluconolactonase/glucosamine-6-phosphate isomerase/deaminase